MASATVINAWKDANNAFVSARVAEGGAMGNVEYLASTPLLDNQGNAKANAQLVAELKANLTTERNAQVGGTQALAGLTGAITI